MPSELVWLDHFRFVKHFALSLFCIKPTHSNSLIKINCELVSFVLYSPCIFVFFFFHIGCCCFHFMPVELISFQFDHNLHCFASFHHSDFSKCLMSDANNSSQRTEFTWICKHVKNTELNTIHLYVHCTWSNYVNWNGFLSRLLFASFSFALSVPPPLALSTFFFCHIFCKFCIQSKYIHIYASCRFVWTFVRLFRIRQHIESKQLTIIYELFRFLLNLCSYCHRWDASEWMFSLDGKKKVCFHHFEVIDEKKASKHI